jgi:hypothetical protein
MRCKNPKTTHERSSVCGKMFPLPKYTKMLSISSQAEKNQKEMPQKHF